MKDLKSGTWCSSAKRENLNDLTLSCYHKISIISLMSFVSLITRNSNTHLNITKTDLTLEHRYGAEWCRVESYAVRLVCGYRCGD